MNITDIGGLPAHPLIVHLPVVLVPLATVGAILMLVRSSWRRIYEIPTAALAAVAAVATQLAIESGESLEKRVGHSDLIETHSHIAEQARPWIMLFAVVMIAVAVVDVVMRRRASTPDHDATQDATVQSATAPVARSRAATAVVALTAVGVLLGGVATVQVYRTGHSGAKATWHDATKDVKDTSGRDGGDDDGDGG